MAWVDYGYDYGGMAWVDYGYDYGGMAWVDYGYVYGGKAWVEYGHDYGGMDTSVSCSSQILLQKLTISADPLCSG
ncbi:hypothetical protein NDU88_000909 [Pleurodeles waltl]|uniref:Uncharacterized protein n=1 Tax=Pleurodeles waltl TaxID=8319 RepID=A0AAV7WKT9_PLEWA|nr:hypothetical protein NDU88_000909 [Pleurodeles waltl]